MLCAAKAKVVIKLLGQSGRIKSCSMAYLSLIFGYADSQAFWRMINVIASLPISGQVILKIWPIIHFSGEWNIGSLQLFSMFSR